MCAVAVTALALCSSSTFISFSSTSEQISSCQPLGPRLVWFHCTNLEQLKEAEGITETAAKQIGCIYRMRYVSNCFVCGTAGQEPLCHAIERAALA